MRRKAWRQNRHWKHQTKTDRRQTQYNRRNIQRLG